MKDKNQIYLDYNATTPVDKEVAAAMRPFLEEHFGNPSSMHTFGIRSRKATEAARKQVSDALGCSTEEIIFTSGGSESNNMAIKGAALANRDKGNHIITSSVEHPAVSEVCKYLEKNGFNITYLPVDQYGMVNPEDVQKAVTSATILVTIMHANNEVGTIQPIREISAICRNAGILMHTDAAQSPGKISTNVDELGVDLLSVAGHKLYAPKGTGALYIRKGVKLEKLIHGADHEQDRRAGTENVLEIVGLGKACEIAVRDLSRNMVHMRNMRELLYAELTGAGLDMKLNGHPEKRLPNTLSLGFRNIEANTLLYAMGGIAASAGAACHTGDEDESSVLKAMGVPDEYSMGTIRFSVGKYTTKDEIIDASREIIKAVRELSQAGEKIIEKEVAGEVRLTQFTHGLGCACKLRPQDLETILKEFPVPVGKDILVSTNTADDAAVYRISEDKALVQTVDFFTPVVDDPYQFGAIGAANSLSDIYAMGAKPLFALNIVGFPAKRLSQDILRSILKGASDKAEEAGIFILGGHTIEDTEPKYGMVVSGIVHPDRIWRNEGAKPGDRLILTKPIGTGIISTAVKRGFAEKNVEEKVTEVMSGLNKIAADIAMNFTINACTDITGFGLLGHLREMTISGKVDAEVYTSEVPLIGGLEAIASAGMIPGGTENNLDYVSDIVLWDDKISSTMKYILCDAQTSGGLLFSVPRNEAGKLLEELQKAGISDVSVIGRIVRTGKGNIEVKI